MTAHRQSDTDACPGALRLHAAADGLLARVRLPGGLLTGTQLAALVALAEEFGDGRLELTSRANLQLRGLQRADAETIAARLRAAGLLPSTTHDAVRNIAAPPLATEEVRHLVAALDTALRADPGLAALPGKFLFAIGHVPLAADVAAIPGDRFVIRLAGHDTGLRADLAAVVPMLLAAAHAFLAEREAQRGAGSGAAWRLHELTDGPARITARLGGAVAGVPVAAPVEVAEPLVGVVTEGDQSAAGALVPLGRLEGVPARVLADAERLVVTPWRGVLVTGLTAAAAATWTDRMAAAGLVVTPTSRWTGVSACAGRPGCAKSLADVRADADAASRFVDGLPVHWVGCERACGSPAGAHVLAEATAAGYRVSVRAGGTVTEKAQDGALADVVTGARRA